MTLYFVFWGAVILIGILFIMSGYREASDEEKIIKKRRAKTFVLVIAVLLIMGSLGFFRGCEGYTDDPSEWVRHG